MAVFAQIQNHSFQAFEIGQRKCKTFLKALGIVIPQGQVDHLRTAADHLEDILYKMRQGFEGDARLQGGLLFREKVAILVQAGIGDFVHNLINPDPDSF
jgi:hypothetical protein